MVSISQRSCRSTYEPQDSRLRIVSPQLSSWIYACDQHYLIHFTGNRAVPVGLSFAARAAS